MSTFDPTFSNRELLALMSAVIYAGLSARLKGNPDAVISTEHCVEEAREVLDAVDESLRS